MNVSLDPFVVKERESVTSAVLLNPVDHTMTAVNLEYAARTTNVFQMAVKSCARNQFIMV